MVWLSMSGDRTVSDKLGKHISGVHVQYNKRSQCGSVLLVQLPSNHLHNLPDLLGVQLKVILHCLEGRKKRGESTHVSGRRREKGLYMYLEMKLNI